MSTNTTNNGYYPITGIKDGHGPLPGQVPLRLEVDELVTNPKYALQLDLLYQAMKIFQEMPYSDKLSYFQVAGIHGLPHIPWDSPEAGLYRRQYCEHGTPLFATWHRPYMALVEQRLYEIMIGTVIPKYPAEYQEVLKEQAAQFRLPYWDWAVKKKRQDKDGKEVMIYDVPLIVQAPEVEVSSPMTPHSGPIVIIDNPFYTFKAKGEMGEYGIVPQEVDDKPYTATPTDRAQATSRWPGNPSKNEADLENFLGPFGWQNNDLVGQAIGNHNWSKPKKFKVFPDPPTVPEAVHRLLSEDYFNTYTRFVTTQRPMENEDPKLWLSLEGIHKNIDRILSIWQTLHEDKWFEEEPVHDKDGKIIRYVHPTDPLQPFRRDEEGHIYDSNASRNHLDFGYTYPELQRWKYDNDQDYKASIIAAVDRLYQPDPETFVALANEDVIINVAFEKFALRGLPFVVNVLLQGKVIGSVVNFSSKLDAKTQGEGGCENCHQQQQSGYMVAGQVFATRALASIVRDTENKELDALSREEIADYLKKHLDYEVVKYSGNIVPKEQMPSLEVFPIVGRRKVKRVPKKGEIQGAILKDGITALPGIGPEKVAWLEAEWNTDGTISVRDPEANSASDWKIKPVGWEAYVRLFPVEE
ncbi:tyrosinase [Coprinopsis cinerea okayama7|uniref:tyrosinase n=1 Tax=Coprinopsis cinerea (strain Okayama-7 / 130 / ATCC MYA-4618 / FGSC 9003) TaxID=240176 RepID=A8NSL2_COPC7|nr:tyrosinase [Coprinopsis cinerea okayama7\|eukprot:XP_001836036.2 tyrosinase [Coprinopsis cinerea okayama7\